MPACQSEPPSREPGATTETTHPVGAAPAAITPTSAKEDGRHPPTPATSRGPWSPSSAPHFAYPDGWTENVPAELKAIPRWVLWRYSPFKRADGTIRWTKLPVSAADPIAHCNVIDPKNWSSFEVALASSKANRANVTGLGIVLGELEDGRRLCGIDLDACLDEGGNLADWARPWLDPSTIYAEVSPSGTGVKAFGLGGWAGGNNNEMLGGLGPDRAGEIEMSRGWRFYTVTGRPFGATRPALVDGSAQMEALFRHIEDVKRERSLQYSKGAPGLYRGRPQDPSELSGLRPIVKVKKQMEAIGIAYAQSGDGYSACCPVHDDTRPSLSFREVTGGRVLVKCHGCDASFEEIMAALGLRMRDAFPREGAEEFDEGDLEDGSARRPDFGGVRDVDPQLIARMTDRAAEFRETLDDLPERLTELADLLGVSEKALESLGTGWREENWSLDEEQGEWVDVGPAWTFPERDGYERIVGIQRRFLDEGVDKRVIKGSKRGLYVPNGWESMSGKIYIPEGASDTAALIDVGLCAIGRPSAQNGAGHLVELLRRVDRDVVVLGENDLKPDGRWPGKDGARSVARRLSDGLRRDVRVWFPPQGAKDIREYVTARRAGRREG